MKQPLHSSLAPSESLNRYISDQCKYYYMPLYSSTLIDETVAHSLGVCNHKDRSPSEIRSSLIKAKKAHYSHIKVPVDRIDFQTLPALIDKIHRFQLGVVLQVCTSFLYDDDFYTFIDSLDTKCEVEWVLDKSSSRIVNRLTKLRGQFAATHLSIAVYKKMRWNQLLHSEIFKQFTEIHLYLSYQFSPSDPFLNCKEAHKLVGMLRKSFPHHSFLPPKGVDIWDHRALPDFDMEPFILPCFETQSANPQIKFSVIIPTFNNQNHLRVVIRHLYKQQVGLDQFEVVVVDDGGTDQTQALVMELIESFPEKMNFKYVFFPRNRIRVMGDSQYRAGISRNLGVKNSTGQILCFLDSDIIVPADYLEKVDQGLETWDALQARRVNLSQSASQLNFNYDQADQEKDFIADEPYWEEFIKQKDWHLMPYNWKYVCTHSFSLKRDLFWKVGGLKKNFIYYGFEDTDLGYRLVKNGYRLHLLDLKVYHMFHENNRSEFMNLASLRHSLLRRTAQIFYLHHLDEDIYENLLGFMEPEPTFQRLVNRMVKTVSLQFLWRPSDSVYRSIRHLHKENNVSQ